MQGAAHRGVCVCDVDDVSGQCDGHGDYKGEEPDHHTGDASIQRGAEPEGPHWVHNGQVSVYAEGRQEEDAGVEVERGQTCGGLAQKPSKRPLVAPSSVRGPHGKTVQAFFCQMVHPSGPDRHQPEGGHLCLMCYDLC
uniref:Uncharacterized protein n=1 Tax=Cynoglossus semilaevis TaxID=244447 RepID=A0A3P8WL64_CYNSE